MRRGMFCKLVFQRCRVEVTRLLRIKPQEEPGCYFYHILLVMEVIKANPDSRDQKATKPSWEKLKVTLREMVNTQTGVIVAIFVNKPPERFYPICSLLCIS